MPPPPAHANLDEASADNPEYKCDMVACSGMCFTDTQIMPSNIKSLVAEAFTDAYYHALQKERSNIPLFYFKNDTLDDKKSTSIVWNGELYTDVTAFQTFFEGLTHTYFDAEDLDCGVLNPKYLPASELKNGSGDDSKDLERRMSITVVVVGSIRLEEQLKGPIREFSESFVLVPNPEKLTGNKINFDKGWNHEWLIQNQNFRFTEWSVNEVEEGGTKAPAAADKPKVNGGPKTSFNTGNRGIAGQFAAAGLFVKKPGTA